MFHSPLSMPGSFKFSILPPFRNAKQFPGFNLVLGSSFQDHGEPYFTMCTLFFLFKNESVSSSVDSGLFFLNISIVVLSISRRLSTVLDIPRKCLTLSRNVCQISKIVQYNLTLNSTIRQKVSRCFTQFGVIFFLFSETSYYLTRNESEIV